MKIEDIFKQGLQNLDMEVSKDLWQKLDSKMQAKATKTHSSVKSAKSSKNIFNAMSASGKVAIIIVSSTFIVSSSIILYNVISDKNNISSQNDKTLQETTIIAANNNQDTIQYSNNQSNYKNNQLDYPSNQPDKFANQPENVNASNNANEHNFDFNDNTEEDFDNEPMVPKPNNIQKDYQPPIIQPQKVIKQYPNSSKYQNLNTNSQDTNTNIVINIRIPNVITPNGDGNNDCLCIKNIENYPDNMLLVYDRNKRLVFQKRHYTNDFCPQNLPSGAYFYSLNVRFEGKIKQFNGSLTIIR